MKKKVLVLIVCAALTLAACVNTTSENTVAETSTVETAAAAESVSKEEPKAPENIDKPEETVEKAEEKTEEKVEEPKEEAKAEESASKAEASTENSAKEPETAKEAASTETASNEKVEEKVAEPTYSTVIEKYIADGDFSDYVAYGKEMGANDVRIPSSEKNIDFYFNDYFIAIRTNVQNTDEYTYVAIGLPDGKTLTYACDILFPGKPSVPISASGAPVSIDSLMILEQTINYMKQHPDPNQIPDIPGTTWGVW